MGSWEFGTRTRQITVLATAALVAIVVGSQSLASAPASAAATASDYVTATVLAKDDFNRNVSSGLGVADVGGPYATISGLSGVAHVSGGEAKINSLPPGRAVLSTLPSVSAKDLQVQYALSFPTVPSARMGLYDMVELRRQPKEAAYYLKVIVGTNGAVALAATRGSWGSDTVRLKEAPSKAVLRSGDELVVQARIVGNKPVILARAWVKGTTPPGWQLQATDTSNGAIANSGPVGFRSYVSASAKPVSFGRDEMTIWSLVPPSQSSSSTTSTTKPPATIPPVSVTTPTPPSPPQPPAPGTGTSPLGLDPTGKTIPDTNYPIPSGAVFLATNGSDSNSGTQSAPVATLNKAIDKAPAGGTIVVRGGVYRDWYNDGNGKTKIATKSVTIQAFPHEKPWFDGTDVVPAGSWQSDGNGRWFREWSTPSFCNGKYYDYRYDAQPSRGPCAHPDVSNGNTSNPAAADPQMAFIDGVQLKEVVRLDQLAPGKFFYNQDVANKTGRIYIATNPNGHTVELVKRPMALVVHGANYAIKGIGFRRYASHEQEGMNSPVTSYAKNTLVESSVFTEMAAGALYIMPAGGVLRSSVFANNGFTAVNSNGSSTTNGYDGLVIDSVLVVKNNTEDFGGGAGTPTCTLSCAYGGIKLAHLVGFTVKNSIFDGNYGNGFWCDNDCRQAVIVNNVSRNNARSGIMYEVSNEGIIASNLVHNNGRYGVIVAAGKMRIYNNTIVNNGGGSLWIYDDNRNTGNLQGMPSVGPDTTDVYVANNVMSGDVAQHLRFSPGSLAQGASNTTPSKFVKGLDYNSYFRPGGPTKGLIYWLDQTGSPVVYKSLAVITAQRGWESHGQDLTSGGDPFFVDAGKGNFTVRGASPAASSGGPLPADVAEAIGVSTSAGQSRGALKWPGK